MLFTYWSGLPKVGISVEVFAMVGIDANSGKDGWIINGWTKDVVPIPLPLRLLIALQKLCLGPVGKGLLINYLKQFEEGAGWP